MEKHEIIIREAGEKDAEALLEIYAPYVKNTAITFEYEVPSGQEFRTRIRNTLKKYPYLAAEQDGKILGYAYTGSFHDRAAYDWAVETSIYVDAGIRHQGVGGKLHQALENVLREQGFLNMNACIAYPQTEDEYLTRNSVQFHAHLGYRLVGEFRQCGYKFDRWYNMVWMEKHIGTHLSGQPAPKSFSEVRGIIREKYGIE